MSLYSELKRRNVIRTGIGYLALSWLMIQIAEATFPAFGLSRDANRMVVIVLSQIEFYPRLPRVDEQ